VTSLFFTKIQNTVNPLTVRCLSVIVRGCLWLADRLAYVVLKLEAKNEH
jgi:hypothetical protein